MAKVYRAQDLELSREVAIYKLVSGPQASDAAYVQRFRNEAVRIAALTHPNIVPIYQFGEDHSDC
jgi:serine/threonine protein kinase